MKVRNGFVSNSSSSSFIVFFPKKPKNVEEVKKMLFEDRDFLPSNSYSSDDPGYSTWQVAATIFEDMNEPLTKEEVLEIISSNQVEGPEYPNYPYNDEAYNKARREKDYKAAEKIYDEYVERVREISKKYATEVLDKNKKKIAYRFHYSDNDSNYHSFLEHGGIFDNLFHIAISHH